MISFKVAASSIFIQAAIERAQLASSFANVSISQQVHEGADSADDKQPVHTMYLMSHVTGNISENGVTVFLLPKTPIKFATSDEVLFTQNFPDWAFKPPKANAYFS